jgi:hypothetical protein
MKSSTIFANAIVFAILISATSQSLIVDREIDTKSFAEGIPLTIKYTFYNTYSKYLK